MNQEILKIYLSYQKWFSCHIDRDEKWKYKSNSDYDEHMWSLNYIRHYRWIKAFLMIESLSFSYEDLFSFESCTLSIRICSIWYQCNFIKDFIEFQRWQASMIPKEKRTCSEYDIMMISRSRNEKKKIHVLFQVPDQYENDPYYVYDMREIRHVIVRRRRLKWDTKENLVIS